jgi:hypothetical protein
MTAGAWRIAMLATAMILPLRSNSQQQTSLPQTKIFAAADRVFQFSYPAGFQVCTKGNIDPCVRSYIPVCEQDALVCVVYPSKQFEGTNFGAASFQVREIVTDHEAMTPDVCVTPSPRQGWPEFLISAQHPEEMISGVLFIHGVSGGAAMSHSNSVDLYRALHKGRCFELSLNETETNPSVTDPPMKTLTAAQQKKMAEIMSDVLHSFRFSK